MSEGQIAQNISFGQSKDILSNRANSVLTSLLEDLTTDIIIQLKEAMVAKNVNASQGLSQSITMSNTSKGKQVSIAIGMDFYWKYVNYGVNGTRVNNGAPSWGTAPKSGVSFHQAILNWIPHRNVKLDNREGGAKTYDQLAWAIQNSVIAKGQKPKHFLEEVINKDLIKVLEKPIRELLGKAIKINIVSPWQ